MVDVRIKNVQFQQKQQIRTALQSIYGIGNTTAQAICDQVGLGYQHLVKDLTEEQVRQLAAAVDQYPTEGDLKRKVSMDIKVLRDIGCYRGKRHRANLPLRGQRTRTNARTRKGPRGKRIAK